MSTFLFRKESDLIFYCAQRVQRILGNCLTKEIYMDALELEFTRAELSVSRDVLLPVYYGDNGEDPVLLSHRYTADFVVNGKILLAVKAEGDTGRMEDYMLLTLLHAAQMQLAILIQFKDRKVQINRVCRYSRYLNSRNIKQDEEATKNVVLTGTRVPD